jgi:hypothetical protein
MSMSRSWMMIDDDDDDDDIMGNDMQGHDVWFVGGGRRDGKIWREERGNRNRLINLAGRNRQ